LVIRLANVSSPQDHTVLVCGQSGVGKTTLLSLLAVDLRESGFPVLFVRSQTSRRPR
jgi:ABC-type lipoprotein export system ATPase subunit